jgi:Neurotransmitter-gated ion-channel ligand binding domain
VKNFIKLQIIDESSSRLNLIVLVKKICGLLLLRRFKMHLKQFLLKNSLKWVIIVSVFTSVRGNPDAKRLYDDLLSNYNRLIRPVSNNTDTVLVKLGLRLSQLIDLVSKHFNIFSQFTNNYFEEFRTNP